MLIKSFWSDWVPLCSSLSRRIACKTNPMTKRQTFTKRQKHYTNSMNSLNNSIWYLILICFWKAPVAEHLAEKAPSLRYHSPLMTYGPLLSCTWQAFYGIWPGKCLSYSYPRKSKWWEEPYLSGWGSPYRHRARDLDWATCRRSRWPTDRSGPGPMTPTWSWHLMRACARRVSQSTDGGWCARGGTSRFWVHCGGSTVLAPPAVGSGRQMGQRDCCQRSWGVKVGDSCARKGHCRQHCQCLLVQRKVQRGHRSCSTQSCWSLLSREAQGSLGCRPHFPPVRCPGRCSFPRSRECIGRLVFCYRAKTQTSVLYLPLCQMN